MIKNAFLFTLIVARFIVLAAVLTACGSSKKINYDYLYFRGAMDSVNIEQKEAIIQANDLLNIQVYSKTLNQQQAAIFNMHDSSSGGIQGYQVSATGTIEMPVIGSIQVGGLTKYQAQNLIMHKLTDYVKNPAVVIRLLQFSVSVLGEVRGPGRHVFTTDKVTIIDALSSAGDLTDFGRRDEIMVIREERGKKIFRTIDMRSKTVFESPVYQLQPNDIVYVRPNDMRLRTLNTNLNPTTQRGLNIVTTSISLVLSIASLFVFIFK